MRAAACLLIALTVLAACDPMDRKAMTSFEPAAGGFRYLAKSDAAYPDDSPAAEADRMRWLGKYLSDNGLCPGGYKLTGRQSVIIDGPIHQITYDGVCT